MAKHTLTSDPFASTSQGQAFQVCARGSFFGGGGLAVGRRCYGGDGTEREAVFGQDERLDCITQKGRLALVKRAD